MAAYTTIDDPSAYFKVQLYTGNGSDDLAITFDDTDTDMQPDFVWIKNRDAGDSHLLTDAVRGVTKVLYCDSSSGEDTEAGSVKSITSDGFTVGTLGGINTNTEKYVSWNWKAGTTASISGGDLTPGGVSINTTSKFGIYIYDGGGGTNTIAHGLGVVPEMVVLKSRSTNVVWMVGHHKVNGGTDPFEYELNWDTDELQSADTMFADTAPSSTLVTIGNTTASNNSGKTYVMYTFASVPGFSKVGSFLGNGNADGTFVYTGFRPAFIMYKKSLGGVASQWYLWDNKRAGYNPTNNILFTNLTNDEEVYNYTDIHSNGFKQKTSYSAVNESGSTYIYYAVAEAPLVNSNGVPCNAR